MTDDTVKCDCSGFKNGGHLAGCPADISSRDAAASTYRTSVKGRPSSTSKAFKAGWDACQKEVEAEIEGLKAIKDILEAAKSLAGADPISVVQELTQANETITHWKNQYGMLDAANNETIAALKSELSNTIGLANREIEDRAIAIHLWREQANNLAEAIREHVECEPGMYGNECVGLGGADGLCEALAEFEKLRGEK